MTAEQEYITMDYKQQNNTLEWIAALLSGEYNHDRKFLCDPETDTYSAFGVAVTLHCIAHHERNFCFLDYGDLGEEFWLNIDIPIPWLEDEFGLGHKHGVLKSLNNNTSNYLCVAAVLLNSVREQKGCDVERVNHLQRSLEHAANVIHAGRVK